MSKVVKQGSCCGIGKYTIVADRHTLTFSCSYLKWTRSNFPSNSAKTLEVLEKCTNDLKNYEELKNDPRHVKVWIEYVRCPAHCTRPSLLTDLSVGGFATDTWRGVFLYAS